jgi:outer membrane receptor for Fe3+-dicitrate
MDLYSKFIIEDDSLILSKVSYHRNLVTDRSKVRGGGWFIYNDTDKVFLFHGTSEEFGTASMEDIKKCVESGNIYTNTGKTHDISKNFKFQYSTGSEYIDLN